MSMNDDYIILRDENGTPYIAHAGWLDNAKNAVTNAAQQVANKAKGVGRGVRQNHKYILKVIENGKARYFYKQEEVKAYYEAKKRGIKNAAEYAQNAVKDKASDVADAVKNVANKATGATANETAETAKKNADDAHRWAKMTERTHKENLTNFKQNPTEANLARAKQSGQAVTRANQNEKNARKEAYKAQSIADQHPANKAKRAFSQAKDTVNNTVNNAKSAYERMKGEFRDKAEQAGNTAKSAANKVVDKARDIAGYDEKERLNKARDTAWNLASKGELTQQALDQLDKSEKQYNKTPLGMIQTAKNKSGLTARKAMKDFEAERDHTSAQDDPSGVRRFNADSAARAAKQAYQDSPLGKIETLPERVQGMIDNARSSTAKAVNEAWDKIPKNADGTVNPFDPKFQSTYNEWKTKKDKYDSSLAGRAKDAAEKATDAVQGMIENTRSSTAKAVNEAWEKIPKNADGTVNPFDSNFQSAYNDWKSKKDKYDGSLTGQAKAAAEKATDSVKDMIDKAKKIAKDATQQISDNLDVKQLQKNLERDMKNHGYSLEDAYNQHKDWLKTMQSGQLPEDHKEYYKKMSELEDQAYKELKAKNSTKSSYTKKPDPINSSGARPYETMKRDAREAGVDFTAYDKAASNEEKLAKQLMKEYREANESSGPKSLTGKMWYDDPEYKRAVEKRKTEEEKLVKQLYQ